MQTGRFPVLPIAPGAAVRGALNRVQALLDLRYRVVASARDRDARQAGTVASLALVVLGAEIVAFAIVLVVTRRALDRERSIVESLQQVAAGRLLVPSHLRIGCAYRSATRGSRIGGDVYDVYALDDDRTLLVIADVSGKGLTAAVETTFVRYALRALACEVHEPRLVVERFASLYDRSGVAPESFVSLFAGVHDRRTACVAYANAGHAACWVRRGDVLEELPPTGPVVGLGRFPYANGTTALAPGDVLLLATDGLTEARGPDGRILHPASVRAWLASADASTPQRLVDDILADVRRHTRGRVDDDLAVLAVAPG